VNIAAPIRSEEAKPLLGVPGLKQGLPLDRVIDLLAGDLMRPVASVPVDIDPVDYEVASHRIIASLREGAWTLARTSSSPLVTECGEYMCAIYDADGHAAAVHAGVFPHVTGTQSGIKFIRYCYDNDSAGIAPGDQFILNEPYLLGLHTPDVLVAQPVFDGDKLVAWVGSLTHTLEMGAKDPGGAADSRDIFQEGLRIPCMKLIEGGRRNEAVFRLIERAVRSPAATILDVTAKVASNVVITARLEEMIKAGKRDMLPAVLQKLIQESEAKALERISRLPDGTWRCTYQIDHDSAAERPLTLQLGCEKRDGRLHFDFEGTSGQVARPINCTLPGTAGGIFSALAAILFPDLPLNQGLVAAFTVSAPSGCLYNPRYPAPLFASPAGPMTLLSSAVTKLISQMAMAAGLNENVCAPWNGNFNSVFMGGRDQHGELTGTLTMDSNGGGTGGTPFDDGDDTAAFMLAPGSIMSDVEMYEATYPLLYVYRRQRQNSCGHGERRGGSGGEALVAVHGSSGWNIGFRGLGTQVTCTHGLFGGYPANSSRIAFLLDARPAGRPPDDYRQLLGPFDDVRGIGMRQEATALTAPRAMAVGDMYYLGWAGGGGFADPLRREPERVAADVAAGLIGSAQARDVYGVVIDGGAIDVAATEKQRDAIRRERLAGSADRRQSTVLPKAVPLSPFTASLAIAQTGGAAQFVCQECRSVLGAADQAMRDIAIARRRSPRSFAHQNVRTDWQEYVEYCCPHCGGLIEVSVEPKSVA
jgi:N-methylhydantoinase B